MPRRSRGEQAEYDRLLNKSKRGESFTPQEIVKWAELLVEDDRDKDS